MHRSMQALPNRIQLTSAGVLEECIGRIYEEVRQRPRFIVGHTERFEGKPEDSRAANLQTALWQ